MLGDHLYTIPRTERDNAVMSYGYSSEGVACNIFPQTRPARVGDHFYTTSQAFHDSAIAALGYKDEGIACYVFPTATQGAVPLDGITVSAPSTPSMLWLTTKRSGGRSRT